ncbi:MAG: cysteine--tRNA ligase, partial [Bacteroidales bacterium]|nr:cysteine--tRNA ligase [Bacteroidales bacterium]
IRFFILQAHYRSTLDFSNEALQAAEKGLKRLILAGKDAAKLKVAEGSSSVEGLAALKEGIYSALCDDLNTPIAIAHLFEAVRIVNTAKEKQTSVTKEDKDTLMLLLDGIAGDVLGLIDEQASSGTGDVLTGIVEMILDVRKDAKTKKDFETSDKIRERLNSLGVQIKDTKEGTEWNLN